MSTEAVNQFLQKISEDEKLQQELTKVLGTAENDREGATALGAKYGYQFTPEELWQEVKNRQSEFVQSQDQSQLSDEELESVAGGFIVHPHQQELFDRRFKGPLIQW